MDELEIVAWNTGRQYTKEGQRIAATIYQGFVCFSDYDRMVSGAFPHTSDDDLKDQVMDHYDNNKYHCGMKYETRTQLEEYIKEHTSTL